MKRWTKAPLILGAGMALILAGCGNQAENAQSAEASKLKVVTTFYPMYEFTKQVAGDHADVTALVPTGVEPHDWEPSAKDMALIQEADVFVYNGLVEGWVESALASTSNENRIVVQASEGISLMEGEAHDHEHEHDEEHADEHADEHAEEEASDAAAEEHADEHEHEEERSLDPHVWLSPVLAQQEVAAIQQALETADPANKDDYRKNAENYIAKLKELDSSFRDELKDAAKREFVTQHAAFAYLAKEYGLTQLPISGLSPDQEPSPEDMAEIVEFAKEHQVGTIFFETLVDPKIAQVVADEIGAQTDVLNPLEGLTEEDIANQLDYIGVMKNNLEALKKALNS